jgi:hypothetical protein
MLIEQMDAAHTANMGSGQQFSDLRIEAASGE